jgi:hypothetical protein
MHWKFFQLLRKKADWALQWIESDSFAERLIALQLLKEFSSQEHFVPLVEKNVD